jgi:hypothetical protein
MKMASLKSFLGFAIAASMLLAFLAMHAEAGVVSIGVTPVVEVLGHGPPDFVWDLLPDESGNAQGVLTELFIPELGGEFGVVFSGAATTDPVFTLTKSVVNNTGATWFGYEIDLDPVGAATFAGTPTSDKFTLTGQTATSLDFGLPLPVANGETVNFTFDILIPAAGPFEFTLTQSPIVPEPTTCTLALAALCLAMSRRRAF